MTAIGPATGGETSPNLFVGPFDPRQGAIQIVGLASTYAYGNAFKVTAPQTVTQAKVYSWTSAGNIDIAIYASDGAGGIPGTRLASTGATAMAATGMQTINLTAPVTLIPGVKYWAVISFSSTGTILGMHSAAAFDSPAGTYSLSARHPLPDPAGTFAASSVSSPLLVTFV